MNRQIRQNRTRRAPRLPLALVAVAALAAVAPAAHAQFGNAPRGQEQVIERPKPPTPKKAEEAPFLWNYLFAVILGGTAFAVALIPSKRGHQD